MKDCEQQELPHSTRRLVARHTGASVRDVAHVIDSPLSAPQADEVLVKLTHTGINGGCETFRARGEHLCARSCTLCLLTDVQHAALSFTKQDARQQNSISISLA